MGFGESFSWLSKDGKRQPADAELAKKSQFDVFPNYQNFEPFYF